MIEEGRKQTMGPSSSSLASKARVREIIEQIIDKENPIARPCPVILQSS